MEDYFPISEPSSAWIQQLFIAEMNDNEQLNLHEQHLKSHSSQAVKTKFSSFLLLEFWCSTLQKYPESAKRALEVLIPFPTTYLCEAAMSALVNIKTTYGNRLGVANDMRIALSNINPRMDELVSKRQEQRSHRLSFVLCFAEEISIFHLPLVLCLHKESFSVCSFNIHLLCRLRRQGVPKPISLGIGIPMVGKVKNHCYRAT